MIIAVDPGKTTGLFAVIGNYSSPYLATELSCLGAMQALSDMLSYLPESEGVHVVCERFVQQSPKITPQYDALETIGVVKWLCTRSLTSLTLQSRSQKNLISSSMLMNVNWWTQNRHHTNDAARHALIWLASHDPNHTLVQQTIGTIAAIG